jgi:hypothetical protein
MEIECMVSEPGRTPVPLKFLVLPSVGDRIMLPYNLDTFMSRGSSILRAISTPIPNRQFKYICPNGPFPLAQSSPRRKAWPPTWSPASSKVTCSYPDSRRAAPSSSAAAATLADTNTAPTTSQYADRMRGKSTHRQTRTSTAAAGDSDLQRHPQRCVGANGPPQITPVLFNSTARGQTPQIPFRITARSRAPRVSSQQA